MFDDDDFVYGLDAEHIREVCLAATRDTNADHPIGDTINVTGIGAPSRVHVTAEDKPRTALSALRRVGYDAEPENRRSIAVHGWSTHRLSARIRALTAARYRLEHELSSAAVRAIDLYTVDAPSNTDTPVREAAHDAARQVGDLLRHEITAITGPHIPHDHHIRPLGSTFDLVARAGEMEGAIARGVGRAEFVATRAVERYIGYLTSPQPPNVPGHKAIRYALRDLRRRENTTSAAEHPAAVAAADHPDNGRATVRAPVASGASDPPGPQHARGRSAHRGKS